MTPSDPALPVTALQEPPLFDGGHWFGGAFSPMRRDPLGTLLAASRLGEVVQLRFLYARILFVAAPDAVRHILQDNHKNYGKDTIAYGVIRDLIGRGLVTSEGDLWRRQRRIAQPAFHKQKIAAFAATMTREAEATLERWRPAIESGEPVNIAKEMTRITLAVVGETMLGGDTGSLAEEAGRRFVEASEILTSRSMRVLRYPFWVPTRENRRFCAARDALDGMVYGLIAKRRAARKEGDDVLSMFLHARDEETGEGMSDQQLRDEVMTMFLAGYETTSVTLAWAFYLLSQHPEAATKLRAELREVLGGRSPALGDMEKLRYTRMVIDETLRLYPPVWGGTRNALDDDVLPGGFKVKKGSEVMFSSWVTHRLPSLWEDPSAFRPERWEGKRAESLPKFAHFPFLGGPRQCIGIQFALMEAVLVLATLLQKVDLELDPAVPVVHEALLTVRPKYGVRMVLRRAA